MARSLTNGDIVEVTSYASLGDQLGFMVWHYVVSGVVGIEATDTKACLAAHNAFAAKIKATMTLEAEWLGISAQIISPNRYDSETLSTDAGPGTNDEDPMPPQVSGLISLRTGVASRRARGRKYVPFPAESNNGPDGKPTVTYINTLVTLADQFKTALIVDGAGFHADLTPVIYSRAGDVTYPVSGYRVRKGWATQRRRSFLGPTNTIILVP